MIQWTEENVEFLLIDGEKKALYDQKGELYMLKKAVRTDRQHLFGNEEK